MPKIGTLPEHVLDRLDRVVQRGRVAGAVGDEQPVRPMLHDLLGGRIGREHGDLHAALGEVAQDVVLRPAVQRDDVQPVAALDLPRPQSPWSSSHSYACSA